MIFETRKVVAIAAVIVATGVAGVEMSRSPAHAAMPTAQVVDYARSRVDAAFAVAGTEPARTIKIAAARKGDKLEAVRVSSASAAVHGRRVGPSTTVLTRTDEYNLAQF